MVDFRDDPRLAAFRAGFRDWLAGHVPTDPEPDDEDERFAWHRAWHRELYAGGWMGLSWPESVGGRGLPSVYEAICNEEVGSADAPPMPHIGFLGRGLLHFGTPAQQERWLPGLLSGDEVWCQGFSEPGAGSDLAGLSTRAEPEGEGWRVTGHKIWTSDARWADWCLLLARTDPGVPRHRGISAMVLPMREPGIEVRPILRIDGGADFCEVFLDGARVPPGHLVGAAGQGWHLAMTTVAYERGPADVGFSSRYRRVLRRIEDFAVSGGTRDEPQIREQLARAYVDVQALSLQVLRSLSRRTDDTPPGPESSIDRLLQIRAEQQLHHAAIDALGASPLTGVFPGWRDDYLYSRAASLVGGTAQIQRTIVAERVLGLPRADR